MENELVKKQVGVFSEKEKAIASFGLGGCFLVFAWVDWNSVETSTGRWAWAYHMAEQAFGPNGKSWFYILLGTLCMLIGFWKWRTQLRTK